MRELSTEAAAVLAEQRGLATRRQLLAHGVSAEALRWRLARDWTSPLPHVVATFRQPPDARQRLIAAQLFAGQGAVIAGTTAAAWHGVTAAAHDSRVLVDIPFERAPRSARFVVVRRTRRPDGAPWPRGPLLIASPLRAVADAARGAPTQERARAIVLEAVQRRIVRSEDLWTELEAGPRSGNRLLRMALDDAECGAWSVPEAELLALVRRSALLPEPVLNPRLVGADGSTLLPIPDLWFPDVGLAVQVHSRRFHEGPDAWDSTVMQDGVFAEHGILLVAVTPTGLDRRPGRVLSRIEGAYRAAARSPAPAVLLVA